MNEYWTTDDGKRHLLINHREVPIMKQVEVKVGKVTRIEHVQVGSYMACNIGPVVEDKSCGS